MGYTLSVGIEVVEARAEATVGDLVDGLGVKGLVCPSSTECARLGSDVSIPSAVPERAPAPGTLSMGALMRFWYPDFMRLFETDSLKFVVSE